jgi:hypothetical protein
VRGRGWRPGRARLRFLRPSGRGTAGGQRTFGLFPVVTGRRRRAISRRCRPCRSRRSSSAAHLLSIEYGPLQKNPSLGHTRPLTSMYGRVLRIEIERTQIAHVAETVEVLVPLRQETHRLPQLMETVEVEIGQAIGEVLAGGDPRLGERLVAARGRRQDPRPVGDRGRQRLALEARPPGRASTPTRTGIVCSRILVVGRDEHVAPVYALTRPCRRRARRARPCSTDGWPTPGRSRTAAGHADPSSGHASRRRRRRSRRRRRPLACRPP